MELKDKEAIINSLLDLVELGKANLLGGMTNKNYLVSYLDTEYVLRLPGSSTQVLINRENESNNSILTAGIGINIDTLYINPNTGIKVTKYIPSAQCFSTNSTNITKFAQRLKKLHQSDIKFDNNFNVFTEFDKYVDIARTNDSDKNLLDEELLGLFNLCRTYFGNIERSVVPCHNDLVPENILLCEDKLYIIDWEYSGMNDPIFDIASFFIETNLTEEYQELFLQEYFQGEKCDILVIKDEIVLYQFCQDILWYVWAVIKKEDYSEYGQERLNRAKSNATKVLSIIKNRG